MFGRKSSQGKEQLAARVRQLSDPRTAAVANEAADPAAPSSPAIYSGPSIAKSVRNKPRAPRQPLFRTATLVTSGGARQNVAVKDLSETGARIEFHTRSELPSIVMLIEPTLKVHKRARVVWQTEGVAGLQFIEE
jgi:PilZ domain